MTALIQKLAIIYIACVLAMLTVKIVDRMPSYEETPKIVMTVVTEQLKVQKFRAASFYVGGAGGLAAYTFTVGGIEPVLRGEGTLEIGLAMFVLLLVFLYTLKADTDPEGNRRRYNFDKYMRTTEYYDPTLDIEGHKSLEDFRDRPEPKSQIMNYDPKDMAEKYRNM